MQRRDFLKTIPLLSLSPLAVGKFALPIGRDWLGPSLPIDGAKTRVMARSIAATIYYPGERMSGSIVRRPCGEWLLRASDGKMRTKKDGNIQRCTPGWSVWMVGYSHYTLPEFISRCEERLRECFPGCEVNAAVFSSRGTYHVTRDPWRDIEFDIQPEESEGWTISWSKEGSSP